MSRYSEMKFKIARYVLYAVTCFLFYCSFANADRWYLCVPFALAGYFSMDAFAWVVYRGGERVSALTEENKRLEAENERLRERIWHIGERALDRVED
jgi:hypothetical protein